MIKTTNFTYGENHMFILSFQSDPCLLYMVTFSDLKGRKEYILCMKTQRRCARHKQVKTSRRHLKSYITLCNITSCNIMEKWKNRPATVCTLHNKVCNITLCNIMEKWTRNSLRLEATRQQMLFYSCYKPFTR